MNILNRANSVFLLSIITIFTVFMASSMTASASNTNFYGNIPSLTEELGTRMVPKINTIYGKTPSDLRIKIKGMLSTYKFDTSNKVHLTNGNKNIVIGFSRTFVAKDGTTHLLIFKLPETKLIYKKGRGYYVNIDDMPDISLKF